MFDLGDRLLPSTKPRVYHCSFASEFILSTFPSYELSFLSLNNRPDT
jgi:hypothetical protein